MRRDDCPDGTRQGGSAAPGAFAPSLAGQSGGERRSTLDDMVSVGLPDGLTPSEPLELQGRLAIH